MNAGDVKNAIAGLWRAAQKRTDTLTEIRPAITLLNALQEQLEAVRTVRDGRIAQLVDLYRQIRESSEFGGVDAVVMQRMGIRKTYYYELKAEAVARGWNPHE